MDRGVAFSMSIIGVCIGCFGIIALDMPRGHPSRWKLLSLAFLAFPLLFLYGLNYEYKQLSDVREHNQIIAELVHSYPELSFLYLSSDNQHAIYKVEYATSQAICQTTVFNINNRNILADGAQCVQLSTAALPSTTAPPTTPLPAPA